MTDYIVAKRITDLETINADLLAALQDLDDAVHNGTAHPMGRETALLIASDAANAAIAKATQ